MKTTEDQREEDFGRRAREHTSIADDWKYWSVLLASVGLVVLLFTTTDSRMDNKISKESNDLRNKIAEAVIQGQTSLNQEIVNRKQADSDIKDQNRRDLEKVYMQLDKIMDVLESIRAQQLEDARLKRGG